MTDGPEWFAPKRYGFGASLPISWQGWAITIGFIVLILGSAFLLIPERPILFFAIIIPATITLVIVSAKTTRGGWRWRWGGKP